MQAAKKDVERLFITVSGGWAAEEWFVPPDHVDYEISGGLKAGALIYRNKREAEAARGDLLRGNPQDAIRYEFDSSIQVLVQAGSRWSCRRCRERRATARRSSNALKERAGTEAEISDLVDLANWARGLEFVDGSRLYLWAKGYGGALALLLAGARPGAADAVAVIDPVTDWDDELDQSDDDFAWLVSVVSRAALGQPGQKRAAHANDICRRARSAGIAGRNQPREPGPVDSIGAIRCRAG